MIHIVRTFPIKPIHIITGPAQKYNITVLVAVAIGYDCPATHVFASSFGEFNGTFNISIVAHV